ncbi:transcriptional regulator, SARP family protein [Saccharothrix sp. ALI-22-I]|nr:AfsR/SARP family transcriptional regulator [Saccharothrix sp. ALI-22-I]ONI92246.1 transcriptional regulator, SARP family protein [Saccharothrix sp. ALI-22-I]
MVTVLAHGHPVDVGPARQRCVLAVLAVDAGRVVSVDRLVERVWGDEPPLRARQTLLSYVSRLRQALVAADAGDVVRRPGGYALEIDPSAVDLHVFRDLYTRALGQTEDATAARLLTEALRLWRGQALTGVDGEWAEAERDKLERERLAAQHDLADTRLRLGHGGQLVVELAARAAEHLLDERVAGQYVLALHQAGRTADALQHYRQLRDKLVDELGTDPGPALQDLHRRILAADPGLTATPADVAVAPVVVPRQLPTAPGPFIGRHGELDRLDATLRDSSNERAGVVISVIAGAGGIGKTWLALHWAHRHADRFPDGHLFVDLRGFSPDERPMNPEAALRGFIDALGVDPRRIPSDLHAQAAMFRSLIAGKRMLLVLDNAADTAQVTSLLPGSPTCSVVITSRNTLSGLITAHGAHHLSVGVLVDVEARSLLTARLGAARVDAESAAANALIRLCGGLPLALSIITGRAHTQPHLSLAAFAAELRDSGLDALDDTDPAASLPTVLLSSYRVLTDEQAAVFGLLAIAPGPDIGLPAAASLTGLSPGRIRTVLRGLEQASLISQDEHGRYRMHDLVRACAADAAAGQLPDDEREAALRRLVDYHVHTAHAAERLLNPQRLPIRLDRPAANHGLEDLADEAAALAWLTAEHHSLPALQHLAAAQGRYDLVWQLAWAFNTFYLRRGLFRERLAAWRTGSAAAEHQDDPAVRILARRLLGHAAAYVGLHDEGVEHLLCALALAERTADRVSQAHIHQSFTRVWEEQGQYRRALEHATQALHLFRELDLPVREASALNSTGWYYARLGDYGTARTRCEAALESARRHHHRELESAVLDSLGYIAHHTSDHTRALDCYGLALLGYRESGNTNYAANTLDRIGQSHAALGQHDHAHAVWGQALELYRQQGRAADAERVQRQLETLGHASHQGSVQ